MYRRFKFFIIYFKYNIKYILLIKIYKNILSKNNKNNYNLVIRINTILSYQQTYNYVTIQAQYHIITKQKNIYIMLISHLTILCIITNLMGHCYLGHWFTIIVMKTNTNRLQLTFIIVFFIITLSYINDRL